MAETTDGSQARCRSRSRSTSLCVLCGLPASGKTTFVKTLMRMPYHHVLDSQIIIFSIEYDKVLPDQKFFGPDLTTKAHSDVQNATQTRMSWKSFRQQISMVIEVLLRTLQQNGKPDISRLTQPDGVASDVWQAMLPNIMSLFTKCGDYNFQLVIIIDDNMYYRSMRYEYFKIAKKYTTGFCQVFFNTSANDAIQRNKSRAEEDRVPENVILKMVEKLEPPNSVDFTWERSSLLVECGKHCDYYQSVMDLLVDSLSNPVQPETYPDEEEVCRSRTQCSSSLLHQGDLILRKCVTAWIMQGKVSEDRKGRAQQAQKAKEGILKKLREDPLSFGISNEWTVDMAASDPSSDYFKFISESFAVEIGKFPP